MPEDSDNKHPLLEYPDHEKKAYLCVVASIASADNDVSDQEIANLRTLCRKVELSSRARAEVMAAAECPQAAPIKQYLDHLRESDLRYTLLADMMFLALADRDFSSEERSEVAQIAMVLGINSEQVKAIEEYVRAYLDLKGDASTTPEELKQATGDVLAGLAAAGVPVAAVAVSGTVWGLSTAGIISGLTALGLGFGLAPGLGVVVAIGVASFFGVRWLFRHITDADTK